MGKMSQEPASCPLMFICFYAMSFCHAGKASRSLRLITAEKMIMILGDILFAEDNHANL
jgi:hypothetical protein